MRKWGAMVTGFYALILVGFLVPVGTSLLDKQGPHIEGAYWILASWPLWIPIAILLASQALLLFLSVDTSFRRRKPRAHVVTSCVLTGMLLAGLTAAAGLCLGYATYGDGFFEKFWGGRLASTASIVISIGVIWLIWGGIFFLYVRNLSTRVNRAATWLLTGSVLELLIAVPCHVIVRRRTYCTAPDVTNFGIVTGLAIMFLSFGPGALLLYKKRLDQYRTAKRAAQ